ncbi:MAG: Stp1/IreP family PP2C-type Ser/Thr phosphatase [Ruminococcaceae bacterium]|nr:Stp1/IreP family PP2C-type Ser/Thr phosphatase [Oscillospiraceae bacterium]
MQFAMKTDTGRVRALNEDSCNSGSFSDSFAWAIVCDGMGGALAGEIASKTAVDFIADRIRRAYRRDMSETAAGYLLTTAIIASGILIHDDSEKNAEHKGMGTTVVACIALKNTLVCANVGDSRGYLLSKHGLRQITHDHSLVQELIDAGKLSEHDAEFFPHRNVITRVLGADEYVDVDIFTVPFTAHDRFLLCTDGLTNMVSDARVAEILKSSALEEVVNKLINEANENGGKDNITVAVIEK